MSEMGFYGSYAARNRGRDELVTGLYKVLAGSREEAVGKMYLMASEDFPPEDGWDAPSLNVDPEHVEVEVAREPGEEFVDELIDDGLIDVDGDIFVLTERGEDALRILRQFEPDLDGSFTADGLVPDDPPGDCSHEPYPLGACGCGGDYNYDGIF